MPLGFHTRHSNRSQQLDSPGPQAQPPSQSSATAATEDKGYDPRAPQPQSYSKTPSDSDQYLHTSADSIQSDNNNSAYELETHGEVPPSRSQSHHYSTSYPHPTVQPSLAAADPVLSLSDDPVPGDLQKKYSVGPSGKVPSPVEPPKKSKSRNFFRPFSSKSHRTHDQPGQQQPQSSQNSNLASLGRRISRRQAATPQDLALQQNNSIERLQQQGDWQSSPSSGTISSPHEAAEDDLDPYLIRGEEVEHPQALAYDPRLGLTVRVVEDSHISQQYQQYQDQQQIHSPQQYNPQQYQIISQHNTPISLEQNLEYTTQASPQQPGQYQQQQNLGSFTSQNQQYRSPQNPEIVSQLSHDPPLESDEQRPPSGQGSQGYNTQSYSSLRTSIQEPRGPPQLQHQSSMGPPPPQAAQGRKSTETKAAMQGDGRGPPSGYNQSAFATPPQGAPPLNLHSPLPPIPGQQPPNYRNSQLQREYSAGVPEGRSTPPLPENRELSEMDKLLIKYKKVKNLYFDKLAQVESLQNTLANQRLSQSRTSLDDSEYLTRFQRLDGAIKEIAFSIRKDWTSLPHWLVPVVNADAMATGTKEMTAVGRAAISRWLADEIFAKCFHPGLEAGLSQELKQIEGNVRFFAPPATSLEEQEAATSKIVQWRLTTMEGLSYRINSAQAGQAKADFVQMAVAGLTAHLLNHLQEGAGNTIQGNATSIAELAVGIASHLSLESRDIVISYPLPGEAVQGFMKVEAPLPPLEHAEIEDGGGEEEEKGEGKKKGEKGKGNLAPGGGSAKKGASTSGEGAAEQKKETAGKIRFAGFIGVEVRGRQWLYNPPVWTIS